MKMFYVKQQFGSIAFRWCRTPVLYRHPAKMVKSKNGGCHEVAGSVTSAVHFWPVRLKGKMQLWWGKNVQGRIWSLAVPFKNMAAQFVAGSWSEDSKSSGTDKQCLVKETIQNCHWGQKWTQMIYLRQIWLDNEVLSVRVRTIWKTPNKVSLKWRFLKQSTFSKQSFYNSPL